MNGENSKFINGVNVDEMILKTKRGMEDFGNSVNDSVDHVAKSTADLSEKTIDTIKKYPLHTALAVGAVGVIAGAIIGSQVKNK